MKYFRSWLFVVFFFFSCVVGPANPITGGGNGEEDDGERNVTMTRNNLVHPPARLYTRTHFLRTNERGRKKKNSRRPAELTRTPAIRFQPHRPTHPDLRTDSAGVRRLGNITDPYVYAGESGVGGGHGLHEHFY